VEGTKMANLFSKLSNAQQYEKELFRNLSVNNKFLYELFWKKGLSQSAEEFLAAILKQGENTLGRELEAKIKSGFQVDFFSSDTVGKRVPGPFVSMVFPYGCVIVQLVSLEGYFQVYVYPGEDKHMPPTSTRIAGRLIEAKNIATIFPDVWAKLIDR
jgi:hypothetical protein